MSCRLAMTIKISAFSAPTFLEGLMLCKPNWIRSSIFVLAMTALCWLQLLAPAKAGERIPPYAIEASALLHQIKQRIPELRTSKFNQTYDTTDKRNLRPDALPFTAGGMLCRLEIKEDYCIAFEIDAEVKKRPEVMEKIKKILSDPCAEIGYPIKTFGEEDEGKPNYWDMRLDYVFRVDEVKRIHEFFKCAKPKRHHYEIMINVVNNLDEWMTPRVPRGAETKKKLLENLVEQVIVPVY
jgi:hypothetical protein